MSDLGDDKLAELLERAVGGDKAAQDALVRAYYFKVQTLVHRELQHDFRKRHRWMIVAFSTGDIVQDVLHGVVRGLDTTDFSGEDAFVGYLATVVRHRITDTVRHYEAQKRDNRRHVEAADEADKAGHIEPANDSPPAAAATLEQVRIVAQVIEGFGQRERALLELRFLDEMQFPEIAQKLGFGDAKSARRAFNRAHARLLIELRARGVQDSRA